MNNNINDTNQNVQVIYRNPRSAVITLLLCAFLGWLGIHRFYLGKAITGLIMLLLSITVFLSCISVIWAFIDLIRIFLFNLKDVNNNQVVVENKTVFVTVAIILLFMMLVAIVTCAVIMGSFVLSYNNLLHY